ncbi:hypothetical protein [Bdellovibrio bacteriovorus]|uniref:hypothetical protein n=1 Tax=Bdellovibrio bacteriovorus TaxID=959 RepID=UPI0035A831EE
MKHLILVAALALGVSSSALAGELDNESSVTNQSMNGTVVIRVDTRTNQTSVLASEKAVTSAAQAQALALKGSFQNVATENVKGELDNDAGASSWYFCNPCGNYNNGYNSYYSYMYWYGSWYTPCYSYSYSYYQYYYYSNYRW